MEKGDATLELAEQLIRCRSVTPADGGALDLIAGRLTALGFRSERVDRNGVGNLWATHGHGGPLICGAGHVDVVPPGPLEQWTSDPFEPVVRGGVLFGRGASDMKGPLAALLTALERIARDQPSHAGTVAALITSDEEGDGADGTVAVVERLQDRHVTIDACLIGEPTSSTRFGDTMKNGRRGSLSGTLRVHGVQCHIAYPERGRNPILDAVPALAELAATVWDRGNQYFPPTSFQISNIHAGTGAVNVIPGELTVQFNFRFSPESGEDALRAHVDKILHAHRLDFHLDWHLTGRPFLTPHGRLSRALSDAVKQVAGIEPALSTSGGTSDGRFLAAVAREVIEFGPVNESIHKVNEHIAVADLAPLSEIYERTLMSLLQPPHREPRT